MYLLQTKGHKNKSAAASFQENKNKHKRRNTECGFADTFLFLVFKYFPNQYAVLTEYSALKGT